LRDFRATGVPDFADAGGSGLWIGLNLFVFTRFDAYPFILIDQNTRLTELVKELSISIETLTMDVHSKVVLERNV